MNLKDFPSETDIQNENMFNFCDKEEIYEISRTSLQSLDEGIEKKELLEKLNDKKLIETKINKLNELRNINKLNDTMKSNIGKQSEPLEMYNDIFKRKELNNNLEKNGMINCRVQIETSVNSPFFLEKEDMVENAFNYSKVKQLNNFTPELESITNNGNEISQKNKIRSSVKDSFEDD